MWRANLDRSDIESINGAEPYGIALDLTAGKVYWTDTYFVNRANPDGSAPEVVLRTAGGPGGGIALDLRVPGDCSEDHTVGLSDHVSFVSCVTGPGQDFAPGCSCADATGDRDVDLADFAVFQTTFTGQ